MQPSDLSRSDPRLLELEDSYKRFGGPVHSLWENHQNGIDLNNFRSDGQYVGQFAERGAEQYQDALNYIAENDPEDYLRKLSEDRAFGMQAFDLPLPSGEVIAVSRDLLDSIMEIYFLQECLGFSSISALSLLDLGAGYGRFAHRLTTAMPNAKVTCTDGVAVSTFLCEFYLEYRQAKGTSVVPLTDLARLNAGAFDVCANIHSWSECSAETINFWLDKLVQWEVPYLFLVPHDPRYVCVNKDGSVQSFRPLLEGHGFRLVHERPKYPRGVNGPYPEVVYYMWVQS